MKLTAQKTLLKKASDIIELIDYADKRIKVREENLRKYEVFTGLNSKYKKDNEITKLAKARLELYYNNTIDRLLKLNQEEIEDEQIYQDVTPEDLETTLRVLDETAKTVKYEIRKEYHLCKREGKGINFDNVDILRDTHQRVEGVINTVKVYNNQN